MVIGMATSFKFDDFYNDNMNGFELGGPQPVFDHNNATGLPNGSTLVYPDANANLRNGPFHLYPDTNSNLTDAYTYTPSIDTISSLTDAYTYIPSVDTNSNLTDAHAYMPSIDNVTTSSSPASSEDSDSFSDIVLNYIGQMLMEENIDEKLDMFQGHPALEATEKPFYEILGEKYPPSHSIPSSDSNDGSSYSGNSSSSSNSSGAIDSTWAYGAVEFPSPQNYPVSLGFSSHSSFGSTNGISNVFKGFEEPLSNITETPNLFAESLPAWQFRRAAEEARKFLPSDDKLVIDLEANGYSFPKQVKDESGGLVEVKAEEGEEYSVYVPRGRKNPHSDDFNTEERRSSKQSAVDNSAEILRSKMFDMVLLCEGAECDNNDSAATETVQNGTSRTSPNGHSKKSGGGKARGKRPTKSETVDLRTLLMHCAQAVATDDRMTANELLRQIRQHSSPFGDGTQRLAHCFADGLEARLAGTGSDKYRSSVAKQATATEILKAYQLYMSSCPFKKISYFFANRTILNVTEKASKVHIVDFGIYYGFQWPCFIKRLSARPGGPPKLRITGIEVPQPGFRPAETIDETGRRLAEYARGFNVPFEYNAIAAKWEDIKVEDIKIEKDEVLVVNCMFRLKNLADETVVVDCPRNMVLETIRKLKPAVFIQGITNGSYSAPFFVTRFREALFSFSALFDMLETTISREDEQRMLIEKTIFGRDALNVIACEGTERVERPETYKQWQVRNHRAGFTQIPLGRDIMEKAKEEVKARYHKDFLIDEDGRWLLQGWKGRIVYAISAWKPNNLSV